MALTLTATVQVTDAEVLDIEKVPARYRGPEPRMTSLEGIVARGEYYAYWLTRTRKQRFSKAYADKILRVADAIGQDKWAVVDREMKALDQQAKVLKKRLDETVQAQVNFHFCPCCGLPTSVTPPGQVGPECSKHPELFPCRHVKRS
jgi:hypothetical protein